MTATASNNYVKIALLQLMVGPDKTQNIIHAIATIERVVKEHKPRVICLPECFNAPYGTEYFIEYSEPIPNGPTCQQLSKVAKDTKVFIIGGSIIEVDKDSKFYNTCTIWCPNGNLIGKHRKIHLFDIDIETQRFKESETLTPGSELTIINIDGRKFGIGICHDIRFEELARIYRNLGCDILVYPAAFTVEQKPVLWGLLQRARATDNQVFVVAISTARNESASYVAYGHTMLVDPWSNVLCEASEKEEVIVADIDFSEVEKIRKQMPIFEQRRTDIYETTNK